ncbi:hypothetical protein PSTG_04570 [Puccinia striiformis f. sp. tritici PST-78]|uniref:F-box domain-containing protein n=1 Tax=Puccinia striiformis f. sp. tritici PST-78 TaxID=1165861 RepID=A0A0L0VS91_9BASI|nr:hypothetical protein PSTG_04570 [Puccinia striiformis f. sp. tritici PST-78]
MSNYLKLLFLRVCRYQSGEDIPPGPSNPNNLQGADEEKDERLDRDEKENEKKQIRAKAEENRKKEMIVGHLGNLPVEVIELIAVYVAIQVPFRPPTSLLNFATINERFYQLLRPEQNDQLYASIFRNLFDVEALQRRFRNFSSSPTYPSKTQTCTPFPTDQHTLTNDLNPSLEGSDPNHCYCHGNAERGDSADDQNEPVNEVHAQLKNASDRDDDEDLKTPPEDDGDDDGCKGGGGGGRRGGEEKAEVEGSSGGCCTGYCQATIFEEERKTRTTTKTDGNVCNNHLAAAYFERLDLFQRMRIFAGHPTPNHPDERRFTDLEPYKDQPSIHLSGNHAMSLISRDLWLIYLMVLENDGRNWTQLLKSANVTGFMLNYFHYEINPSAVSPGYPSERPETAIALRLCHLFLDLQQEQSEPEFQSDSTSEDANYWTTEAGIETYLFALKPYTFASHQYDVAYAPWSIRELPINLSSPTVLQTLSQKLTAREKATLTPIVWDTSLEEHVNGRRNLLSSPAVINRSSPGSPSPLSPAATDEFSSFSDCDSLLNLGQELAYMGKLFRILPPLHSHVALLSFFWCNIRHTGLPGTQALESDDQLEFFLRMMRNVLELKSVDYDREFARQTSCLDPFISPGLQFDSYQGCFKGGWDGQFGFFDLSSYRQMLLGRIESVYEGRYGDQNQVYKVQEFIVRVRDDQPVEFLDGSREKYLEARRSSGGSESRLDDPHGRSEEPLDSEIERLGRMKSLLYPIPIDPIPVKYDPTEQYELQIHGAGHSSWGHFKVKGRIRSWDGMVTFLKIYDTGRHGRWLYRGYHAPGNMIVGRWRDTLTSEADDGYEGTFVMFTRN